MTDRHTYNVSLFIQVNDKNELFDAAYKSALEDGLAEEQINETLKPDGEVSVENCLRWLVDPGESPPGCSILDSTCE